MRARGQWNQLWPAALVDLVSWALVYCWILGLIRLWISAFITGLISPPSPLLIRAWIPASPSAA